MVRFLSVAKVTSRFEEQKQLPGLLASSQETNVRESQRNKWQKKQPWQSARVQGASVCCWMRIPTGGKSRRMPTGRARVLADRSQGRVPATAAGEAVAMPADAAARPLGSCHAVPRRRDRYHQRPPPRLLSRQRRPKGLLRRLPLRPLPHRPPPPRAVTARRAVAEQQFANTRLRKYMLESPNRSKKNTSF